MGKIRLVRRNCKLRFSLNLCKEVTNFAWHGSIKELLDIYSANASQLEWTSLMNEKKEDCLFKFIDLFAGIGGMRIAFEHLGGECVLSSEWDTSAQETYRLNFEDKPEGDIREIDNSKIPYHDVLLAGFPCQAFSIAGRRGGFDDIRGTLFYEVARIIKAKQPRAFFLENVKGLMNHDKGKTLETILNVLRNDLSYFVPDPQIMNAKDFGVPQNRERVFIIGFHSDLGITDFTYPKPLNISRTIKDIMEKDPVSVKYYLSNQYLNTLIKHRAHHQSKGNGFGYEIKKLDDIASTIVVGGMGKERNLIIDDRLVDRTPVTKIKGEVNIQGIRRMTPREWARLQGFPEDFAIKVSDAQAYKQFGNSVAIPAIMATGREIIKRLYVNQKKNDLKDIDDVIEKYINEISNKK